jgi:hypothetical protein
MHTVLFKESLLRFVDLRVGAHSWVVPKDRGHRRAPSLPEDCVGVSISEGPLPHHLQLALVGTSHDGGWWW